MTRLATPRPAPRSALRALLPFGLLLTLTPLTLRAGEDEPEKPAPPDPAAVARGNSRFAFDLYGRLRAKEGNLFCSPYSISTALQMLSAGAGGNTLEQMTATLHLPPQDQLHQSSGALLKAMNDPARKGYQLSVANGLWGQKGYPFIKAFLDVNRENYGAGVQEVDFGEGEAARKTINSWVEKETKERIKDLIPSGLLDRNTRLVLTNAIHFKGDWASQFKKDRTREARFYAPGKPVEVQMMHQSGKFQYLEEGQVQVVELPFVGNDLSMVFVVPTRQDGLAEVEKELTADRVAGWVKKLALHHVEVFVPRFKMTAEFQLKPTLSAMGMEKAFNETFADFSGVNGGKEKLHVAEVVHKAFVEVNETGAEAAAATGIAVKSRSAEKDPVVRADRPFLFLIRDRKSDSILFVGRLVTPGK